MQLLLPVAHLLTRASAVWRWSLLAALIASTLVIAQDVLYGGLPAQTRFDIALAQYTLPWFTWALLAPALLLMFARFPIDLRDPWWSLAGYSLVSVLVVGVKLVLTVPITAVLIWKPLSVETVDGVRWLLANRATSNLIIFWMLLAVYTGYRYYTLNAGVDRDEASRDPLSRIPVRLGERTGFVPIEDISFIEAERNHLVVHTANAQHSIRSTLHDLEHRLPHHRFVRIHRSRLINLDRVEAIEPWGRGDYLLIMKDGSRLVSGKTYREAVRRLLQVSQSSHFGSP
jgi:hypothetical protein